MSTTLTPPPAAPAIIRWTCSGCGLGRAKPEKRLPTGWKRRTEDDIEKFYCPDCWRKLYILRAVTIAIAAPEAPLTWDDLRLGLRNMWALTTQASNWILTELYIRDVRRDGSAGDKLPPMAAQYLYPEMSARFPGLPSQARPALEKAVTAKYKAKRYEVLWTCAASLPTHRYPTPYPVPNQAWSLRMDGDQPVVSLPLGGHGRVELRLRGGVRYYRQLASCRAIAAGDAQPGQMDIYSQGKHILVKMVAWLPRKAYNPPGADTLVIRTSAESLIVALNVKDAKLWVYHADQVRRWAAEHRKQLHRWADDSKAEHRPDPPFSDRRTLAAQKFHRRMSRACHGIAAMIVGYAVRRKFSEVSWDDRDHSFCPDFTWADLTSKIIEKCDAAGVEFKHITGPMDVKPEEPA